MANSLIYPKFMLRNMGNNGTVIDLDADTIKAILLNSTYAAIADATKRGHEFYSDVSANEISGTGYTAGGQALTSRTSSLSTNVYTFDAADPAWSTATISAYGAGIYKDTGTPSTSPLIAYLDFGGVASSTAATFTVQLSASGIFTITM